ncbi:MAG: penicillin-binding protein [Rhodothermales bacterium]|nr:penicillin-binding protein [Rhodothermales bacterium]
MSDWPYSPDELKKYFGNPEARKRAAEASRERASSNGNADNPFGSSENRSRLAALLTFENPRVQQAVRASAALVGIGIVGALGVLVFLMMISRDLPDTTELENPEFQLATVAYSADGVELQRYARQNRSWATFDEISPNVVNALITTEDHRFMQHSGIDVFRTLAIPYHVLRGAPQGGSTITQQLARNLYNERIGRKVTVERKLKEMVTALQLERRYTKEEIVEMYLNTVEFGQNAFGIDAAARTFFGKNPADLDVLESATLVGMLQRITAFNPIRNPESSRRRRNIVMGQMVKNGVLDQAFLDEHRADSIVTNYRSSEITEGTSPYFSEYVRNWLGSWAESNGFDIYTDGLVVHTTLDTRVQEVAQRAVREQAEMLQKVVDYEWSRRSEELVSTDINVYVNAQGYEPFSHFWNSKSDVIRAFIRESRRYRQLRAQDVSVSDATSQLMANVAFMDSIKAEKSRLEAGLVSIDPRNGYVRAWVGGRDLSVDWYDHVGRAKRQPGSTFKPFVYTAAIDNGYSPYHMLMDSTFVHIDVAGNEWSPQNSGDPGSGELMTLRDGLIHSKNTITGRLILLVRPQEAAFYARRMGIKSELAEVPALALGVSDVSLLELTAAYSTFANGGLAYEPTVVTKIEDQYGNVLYEALPTPQEALSEETAYAMVDILRGVVKEGTGRRINAQFGLGEYDIAGKTGTTQLNGDGWFIGMTPELVTGAWVGFNDRRVSFRSDWWGQGAHNALLLVGEFLRQGTQTDEPIISKDVRFPTPAEYGLPMGPLDPSQDGADNELEDKTNRQEHGRVGW